MSSAYWNGAATYYRGVYKNLHALGYDITFAEPDILGRQRHRDWSGDPPYARCPVYRSRAELEWHLRRAREADLIVKHSGVGAEDDYLEAAVLAAAAAAPAERRPRVAYWDVDAPATLAAMEAAPAHPLRRLLPEYDYVFTYGGGPPVAARFRRLGARACFPIYNGLDPDAHFPAPPAARWQADLSFLAHRLPDREARVERFFLEPARRCPQLQFLLAGEGWTTTSVPPNVHACGFVPPSEHNVLNASARLVLNVNRAAMAEAGFSPPTRIFEAAGAAAAVVSDTWPGMSLFFEPGREILIASGPEEICGCLTSISPQALAVIGRAARERALTEHTYRRRAERVDIILHAAAPHCEPAPAAAA